MAVTVDGGLARRLVLDELFDLSLYQTLREHTAGAVRATLDELIPIEARHFAFWQEFFDINVDRLDLGRRLKLRLLDVVARLLGSVGVELILEAIEVYGVRKYLEVWDAYRDGPLGEAVERVLDDEFRHEDEVVAHLTTRKISPERIRDIFLGLNDGLVEILGAVSGFFGVFANPATVLLAAVTTAIAGALSMAAGAYVAMSSGQEVAQTERRRGEFLRSRDAATAVRAPRDASGSAAAPATAGPQIGAVRGVGVPGTADAPAPDSTTAAAGGERPLASAFAVGASYLAGAIVPVLPVAAGATTAVVPLIVGGSVVVVVSLVLAFLSGMNVRKRIAMNLAIVAAAVAVTYLSGLLLNRVAGVGGP